jgi:hypothetical protein
MDQMMDQRPLFFHRPHEEYGSHAEDRRSIFVIKRLSAFWRAGPKYRKPGDLVFANAKGEPANRRNLLRLPASRLDTDCSGEGI